MRRYRSEDLRRVADGLVVGWGKERVRRLEGERGSDAVVLLTGFSSGVTTLVGAPMVAVPLGVTARGTWCWTVVVGGGVGEEEAADSVTGSLSLRFKILFCSFAGTCCTLCERFWSSYMCRRTARIKLGLSLFGMKWDESTLIELAHAFEQRSMARENGRGARTSFQQLNLRMRLECDELAGIEFEGVVVEGVMHELIKGGCYVVDSL